MFRHAQIYIISLELFFIFKSVYNPLLICLVQQYSLNNNWYSLLPIEDAVITSINLYLDVNFERKVLSGKANLHVEKRRSDVTHVVSSSFSSRFEFVLFFVYNFLVRY